MIISIFLFHWNVEFFKQIKTKESNPIKFFSVKYKFEVKRKNYLIKSGLLIPIANKEFYVSKIKIFIIFI